MFPEKLGAKRMLAVVICLFISFCLAMPFLGDKASAESAQYKDFGRDGHAVEIWCYNTPTDYTIWREGILGTTSSSKWMYCGELRSEFNAEAYGEKTSIPDVNYSQRLVTAMAWINHICWETDDYVFPDGGGFASDYERYYVCQCMMWQVSSWAGRDYVDHVGCVIDGRRCTAYSNLTDTQCNLVQILHDAWDEDSYVQKYYRGSGTVWWNSDTQDLVTDFSLDGAVEIQKGSTDIRTLDTTPQDPPYTLNGAWFGVYEHDVRNDAVDETQLCLTFQDDPTARWFIDEKGSEKVLRNACSPENYYLVSYRISDQDPVEQAKEFGPAGIYRTDNAEKPSSHWTFTSSGNYVTICNRNYNNPQYLCPSGSEIYAGRRVMTGQNPGTLSDKHYWEIIDPQDGSNTFILKNKADDDSQQHNRFCLGLGNKTARGYDGYAHDPVYVSTDGAGQAIAGNLTPGNYVVYEVKPPAGYTADTTSHPVSVGSGTTVFTQVRDTPELGDIDLFKVKDNNGAPLGGVQFGVWKTQAAATNKADMNPGEFEGTFLVNNAATSFTVLDADGGKTDPGTNIQGYVANWTDAQKWTFESAGGGYYYIKNKKSGLVLDIANGEQREGQNVQIYNKNNTDAQKWKPERQADGTYLFKSTAGYVLDLQNGSAKLGTNVQIWSATNITASKKWRLVRDSTYVGSMTTQSDGYATYTGLPFGTYYVREISAPAGYLSINTVFPVEVDSTGVHHANNGNPVRNRQGEIHTDFMVKSGGAKEVSASAGTVTFTDRVSYSGLEPGSYTLRSSIHYQSDGSELTIPGATPKTTPITVPASGQGSEDVDFTFDVSSLAGKKIVVYEQVIKDNNTLLDHSDKNDARQTVSFPSVTTTAVSASGLHAVQAGSSITLTDTVTASNVTQGKKYKIKGTLYDKATRQPLVVTSGNVTDEGDLAPAQGTTITEQLTYTFNASNLAGKTVVCYATLVDENGTVLGAHENINDTNQTIDIVDIGTTAIDQETGTHEQLSDGTAVVVDTVHYTNLTPGKTYRIVGHLYDKAEPHGEIPGVTGGVIDPFEPQTRDGDVEVHFTVPNSALEGKTYVAFETLYLDGRELAVHADIEDADQTIYIPKLRTQASDQANADREVQASAAVTINDTVSYNNLQVGQTYHISGYLVDKTAGSAKITGTDQGHDFRPTSKDGNEPMSFTFDARPYIGHDVVVFETVSYNGKPVANHMDITDPKQTVRIIDIGTTNTDAVTGLHETQAGTGTVLKDEVRYTNLTPGTAYKLEGTLVDKSDPDRVISTGSADFTPEQPNGTVPVEFAVDTSLLEGHDLVAFEVLKKDGDVYATHRDIEDAGQTVHVVDIHTLAYDEHTGLDEVLCSDASVIIDEVSYVNLTPGQSYTMSGKLVDKATGEVLVIGEGEDAREATSFQEFTPEEKDGTVRMLYTIPSRDLAGRTFVAYETLKAGDKTVAVHEDIDDEAQTFNIPDIHTTALDGETHEQLASETAVITDTVAYTNLQPGKEYKVTGTLMLRKPFVPADEPGTDDPGAPDAPDNPAGDGTDTPDAGDGSQQGDTPDPQQPDQPGTQEPDDDSPQWQAEPLDVAPVSVTFTPEEPDGTVDVVFEIDSSKLKSETVVVFEELSRGDVVVAVHADIEDEGQAVYIPEIQTQATATSDGTHQHLAGENASITDKVAYWNLQPGKEYAMHGTLMDKDTGEPLLDAEGAEITVDKAFVPEKPDGEIELVFEFDASLLGGHTLVAFERLEHDGKDVAVHADITDEEQSVHFPKIRTLAIDSVTAEHISGEFDNRKIVDTVSYANLDPVMGYTLVGTLMDKDTGKQVEKDGKPVTATKDFEASEPDGETELEFDYDATELGGHVVVVFESLYRTEDDVLIAEHADIDDDAQSVNVPKIGTKAAEKGTGNKEIDYAEKITVVDVVSYKNLIPGKAYKMSGHMVDKGSGKDVPSAASTTFTPEGPSGSIEVEMEIDAKGLDGHSLVAFEELYLEDELIAEHKDLEDADQTVIVKNMDLASDLVKRITDSNPIMKTNDDAFPLGALLIAAAMALAATTALVIRKRTIRKK